MLMGGDDRAREGGASRIAAMAARLLAKVRDKIIDGDRGVMCTSSGRAFVMRGGLWEGYRVCR